jgi:hypothetical protein
VCVLHTHVVLLFLSLSAHPINDEKCALGLSGGADLGSGANLLRTRFLLLVIFSAQGVKSAT